MQHLENCVLTGQITCRQVKPSLHFMSQVLKSFRVLELPQSRHRENFGCLEDSNFEKSAGLSDKLTDRELPLFISPGIHLCKGF